MVMRNRPEDVLARIDGEGVIKPTDWEIIRAALKCQIVRPVFMPLDWDEWKIGRIAYPNWIGYTHIHKLLTHPGEQIHVYELTGQSNLENSRKAVQKCISRATGELVTTHLEIGTHLKTYIKTGEYCTYTGTWDWQLSA